MSPYWRYHRFMWIVTIFHQDPKDCYGIFFLLENHSPDSQHLAHSHKNNLESWSRLQVHNYRLANKSSPLNQKHLFYYLIPLLFPDYQFSWQGTKMSCLSISVWLHGCHDQLMPENGKIPFLNHSLLLQLSQVILQRPHWTASPWWIFWQAKLLRQACLFLGKWKAGSFQTCHQEAERSIFLHDSENFSNKTISFQQYRGKRSLLYSPYFFKYHHHDINLQ